jgi:hypothetical protein
LATVFAPVTGQSGSAPNGVGSSLKKHLMALINPQFFEPDQREEISSRNNHPERPLLSFFGVTQAVPIPRKSTISAKVGFFSGRQCLNLKFGLRHYLMESTFDFLLGPLGSSRRQKPD